ncbi:apolipoprotein D-like [Salvelinus alpinus]|uniref:apolipoprotein D-like n=1 Tax=Salvelinus alpinus TaxID=8036 RepID=UPI0039FDCFF3
MHPLQVLCVVLVTASVAHAQTVHLGRCPTPPVQQDFNVTKYLGRWYEAEKLPALFEREKCQQATYSLLCDRTHTLTHHRLYEVSQTINMNTHNQIFFKGDPYLVLSTDYSSFSLVYSCTDFLINFYVDFAWIVSRTRSLPSDVISRLHGDLEAIGVDLRCLTVSNQTACDTVA